MILKTSRNTMSAETKKKASPNATAAAMYSSREYSNIWTTQLYECADKMSVGYTIYILLYINIKISFSE